MSETATAALSGDNGASQEPVQQPTSQAPAGNDVPWYGKADEDTSAYIQNKGWKDPSELISSYRNLEKFAGGSKNLVELPGVDADEEALGNFYNKLGRPEDPNGYTFQNPEGGDENLFNWFKGTAHEIGLNDKQAANLLNKWQEMNGGLAEQYEQSKIEQAEADMLSVKREWGAAYEQNIDAGRRAARELGYSQEELSTLESSMGTGQMLKMFAKIGSRMGEDTFENGDGNSGGFGISPAQAQSQIGELKSDKAFMDAYLKGDKAAISKMQRLMELAYGK